MPPNMRFNPGPMAGPQYHQQQFSHAQQHHAAANAQYLASNAQMNPFAAGVANNNLAMAFNASMVDPSRMHSAANTYQQQQAQQAQQQQAQQAQQQVQQQQAQQQQQQYAGQQASQQAQVAHQHVQTTPQQHMSAQQHHVQHHPTQTHISVNDFVNTPQAPRNQNKGRIREVWAHNLHEEMALLRSLVTKYPYIAMDTEFPGVVSRPMGSFRGKSDYHYQCLRTNVDMLKVIQIGITLFNEASEMPPPRLSPEDLDPLVPVKMPGNGQCPYSWQFNFQFSLRNDMYNEKSIESLQTAGIDFAALERDGIDPHEFAALLIPSGLVCFDDVKWISFHGGYDFGYLTKLLICEPLPNDEVDFDRVMKLYFPATYDVKHLMKHAIKLNNSGMLSSIDAQTIDILTKFEHKSGLENIAETLKIKRVGSAHQAGSDSLLTGRVFFQMRQRIFRGVIPPEHVGRVWGLNIPDNTFGMPTITAMDSSMNGTVMNGNANGNGYPPNGNGPSTPNTTHATLSMTNTPNRQTPGGGNGNFGHFSHHRG